LPLRPASRSISETYITTVHAAMRHTLACRGKPLNWNEKTFWIGYEVLISRLSCRACVGVHAQNSPNVILNHLLGNRLQCSGPNRLVL